jgi:hypothetical protein
MEYSAIQFVEAMFQYISSAAKAKVAVWSTNGKGPYGSELS